MNHDYSTLLKGDHILLGVVVFLEIQRETFTQIVYIFQYWLP